MATRPLRLPMITATKPSRWATARVFTWWRQWFVALGLALALLVMQHGALLHAVGHLQEQIGQHQGHPGAEQCGKCLALASLAGAPPPSHSLTLPGSAPGSVYASLSLVYRPGTRLAFSSRAPPLLQP